MHRGHDHHHDHNGGGGAEPATLGHNHARPPQRVAQWQTPHLPHTEPGASPAAELDLDLVESAFVEGFAVTTDPTSFLRLACVPFEATAPDGTKLVLLRVETDAVTDVGSVMPHLGGASLRYDPLPAGLVARRRRLRFVYFDGQGARSLSLAEVRALAGE
jgi:hypothetical protein